MTNIHLTYNMQDMRNCLSMLVNLSSLLILELRGLKSPLSMKFMEDFRKIPLSLPSCLR